MVNIKTLPDRIIFDGHADTAKECETITLMCDGLAANNNFKTVAYRKGYAEFEKVGVARELKFLLTGLDVVIDGHITKVIAAAGDSTYTTTTSTSGGDFTYGNSPNGIYSFTVELTAGYIIDTVTSIDAVPITMTSDTTFTVSYVGRVYDKLTITSKQSTPKVTVDLTSLSGYESLAAGSYQLAVRAKAANYQDSDLSSTVSFTKLAAPVATASDTTVTWEAITNAESYDVYVDGELYENTDGGGVTPKGYNITIASKYIYTGSGYTIGYLAVNREVSSTDWDYKLTASNGKLVYNSGEGPGTEVTLPITISNVSSLSALNAGDSNSWFKLTSGDYDIFNIYPSNGVTTVDINQDYTNCELIGSNND